MLSFLRSVFKWLAALVVASGLFVLLVFLVLAGFAASLQPKPVQVESGSVLVIDLGMNLVDSPRSVDPLAEALREVQGLGREDVPLRHALSAIKRAGEDDRIVGILLRGNLRGAGMGNSIPAVHEFRAALARFRDSGKRVWAYVDNDGMGDYFVKSVADHVWMNPYSMVELKGLGTEVLYWGETFEQLGVGVQVVRAGRYKSAAESFVQSSMSPENREQTMALLESIWSDLKGAIASARGYEPSAIDAIASRRALLVSEEALDSGLVDELVPYDDLIDRLIQAGRYDGATRSFREVRFSDYRNLERRPATAARPVVGGSSNEIAVVYIEGAIIDGEGDGTFAGAAEITRLLREVRQDDAVKAVVLRVNSPGGSATASEKILREVELTAAAKPVVASMGGYAASGGYWVSSLAHAIVADPSTVTGSIGVVSVLPNVAGLAERFDLNVERVETNRLTSVTSIFRPKTEEELARFQEITDYTYQHFIDRVSRGRKMEPARVREIAEGRVWSGQQALEIGLVDRLGGLDEALAHAGDLAGIGNDFRVSDHPRERTMEEILARMFSGNTLAAIRGRIGLPVHDARLAALEEEVRWFQALDDPRHAYAYSPLRLRW